MPNCCHDNRMNLVDIQLKKFKLNLPHRISSVERLQSLLKSHTLSGEIHFPLSSQVYWLYRQLGMTLGENWKSSRAISPNLPLPAVALNCSLKELPLTTAVPCIHWLPWLPVFFHRDVALVLWSTMVSSREPVVAPYMWYQNVRVVESDLPIGLYHILSITAVWPLATGGEVSVYR